MPGSGMAARQLIREPSSCPAFQAVSSSYPVPGGRMGGKGEGPGARDYPPRYREWVVRVCAERALGGACKVEWAGYVRGRKERRVTGQVISM